MKYLKDVAKFMTAMGDGQKIISNPRMINPDRAKLRVRLQQEELREYEHASDIIDVADALADQLYILLGTVLEHGLADKFDAIWDEVQRSNMSKICAEEEISPNIMRYEKEGVPVVIRKIGENSVLVRRSDGKILKPLNYSPANLKPIVFNDGGSVLIKEEDPTWKVLDKSEVSTMSGLEIRGDGVLLKIELRSAPHSLIPFIKREVKTLTLYDFIPNVFILEEVNINGGDSKFSIVDENASSSR